MLVYEKMGIGDCERKLKTSINRGLTSEEAVKRLRANGENKLLEGKKKNIISVFFGQLKDPMIYILIIVIAVSLMLKEFGDAIIITSVILLNGFLGTVQEAKAENAIMALKQMTHPICVVKRDGKIINVPSEELVVGDVVVLESGRKVPADVRLIETRSMKVEEAALTGESVPVEKNARKTCLNKCSIGDMDNMAFMSTTVVNGRGEGIVVATGMKTEVGKIAGMIKKEQGLTPLQIKLAELGKVLGVVTIMICALLVVIGAIQKRNLYDMVLTSISLAVAAIPEGLPAVVAIVLSLGVQRMAKCNAIVRKLSSVETLGAVNVVCSDKTGTLTQNKMVVERVYTCGKMMGPYESGGSILMEGMVLCNDAVSNGESVIGDPTEIALVNWGCANGVKKEEINKKYKRIDEYPFDSNRKMMSTQHLFDEKKRVYTKGAVDEILNKSNQLQNNGVVVPITEKMKNDIIEVSRGMASKGERVLALAYKDENEISEKEMIFVGMVSMRDPARPEAKKAIKTLSDAGIKTVMITGDHIQTAFSVALELGIAKSIEECINGEEVAKIPEEKLSEEILKYRVFARVSPENKLSIVKSLKSNGLVVAMTGDGVNDAPSLKCADIGISMGGSGTDVAKEASDMVLNDDNFATIASAVEEGRVIYENIKKSVLFLLSSNLAEIVAVILSVIIGLPVPFAAIHVLWINLITDTIPALALGGDSKEDGVMKKRPRKRSETMFSGGGWKLVLCYGVLIGVISVAAFVAVPVADLAKYGCDIKYSQVVRLLGMDDYVLKKAQTFSFVTLACCELIHAVGMRNVNKTVIGRGMLDNKMMVFAVVLGFAMQWIIIEVPLLNGMFKLSDLFFGEWLFAIGCSLLVILFHEIFCLNHRKK